MSMLRNVLTYMGLGPDEDYDDGYLYESADNEIDLTEDEPIIDDPVVDEDYKNGVSPFGDPEVSEEVDVEQLLDGSDPHAQRNRPDWLEPPAPTSADATGFAAAAVAASGRRRISIDDDEQSASNGEPGRHSKRSTSRVRPLRAVPPSDADEVADGVRVRPFDDEPVAEEHDALDEVLYVKPKAIAPRSFGDAKTLADEFKAQVPVIMNLQDVDRELARRLIDFASGICYAMDGSMEKIASQVFLLTPQEVEVSDEDRRRVEQRGYDR